MMPATCVPWPKPSPAVVAPRRGDDVGDDARAAVAPLKSGRVAGDAGVDHGDADALAGDAARPQLVGADRLRVAWWRAARADARAVHARVEREADDVRVAASSRGLLGRQLDGEAVDERDAAGDLAAVLARRACAACVSLNARLELHDRGDLARRGLLATDASCACADGAAWATVAPSANGTTAATRATVSRLRQRDEVGINSGHLLVPLLRNEFVEAGGRAISHPWRPLALRPRLATGLPFSALLIP